MEVSASKIKCFKSCRRMYQLKYVEKLLPVNKSETLELGSNYHALLEELNNTGKLPECDFSKEYAMAKAYEKYIFPHFNVIEAEKKLELDLGNGNKLVGIVDGIADDGHIVEHKTSGLDIGENYEFNLQWDEQIPAYMLMTGKKKVWYTVCKKPTIRLKKDETEEEFYQRMLEWYDDNTESKIRVIEVYRTDDELNIFLNELKSIVDEMSKAHYFYRNNSHCTMYGKRCEYSSVCLNYDPNQEYLEFTKGE